MSQAIQYNSSVAMIRHPRFLQRAADLTPTLQRLRQDSGGRQDDT